jgi:hypothetical protein
MKNKFCILFLVFSFSAFSTFSLANATSFQGVMYQLTVAKNLVEARYVSKMGKDGADAESKKAYWALKLAFDAALNQFEYELNSKSCLARKFKKIDASFKKGTQKNPAYSNTVIQNFAQKINLYLSECEKFINPSHNKSNVSLDFSGLSPLDIVSDGWGIYKDIHDMQVEKANGLAAILNTLRLSSINDLEGK